MSFIEAVVLGLVQGLTEFLPVSSSGHLVFAKMLLGIKDNGIAFEIFVHFGTLIAVLTVYKDDIIEIFVDCGRVISKKSFAKAANQRNDQLSGLTLLMFIVIGTVPAVVSGLLFRDVFETAFSNAVFVSSALIFTGLVLMTSRLAKDSNKPLNHLRALLVGLAQVLALFPGVSRSGTTITTALLLGVRPAECARYSFLLAVPLILGVTLMESYELLLNPPSVDQLSNYVVGCLAAYISGLWAIRWLVSVVQRGRFDRFAYYCLAVGLLGLTLSYVI